MTEKICPNCNKLENLENCFDSNLPLCKECCKQHLNQWKSKANKELDDLEEEIQQNNELVGKTNSDSESGGSDSEPSIDNYDEDQLMKLMPGEKKKAKTKNKSKKKQYLTTSKVAKIVGLRGFLCLILVGANSKYSGTSYTGWPV